MADNQLNAKPVVKQRHPGDGFRVSLKRIHKRLTNDEQSHLKAVNLNQSEFFFKYEGRLINSRNLSLINSFLHQITRKPVYK